MGKSLFRITDIFICKEVPDIKKNAISECMNKFTYKNSMFGDYRLIYRDAKLNDVFEFSITSCGKNLHYNDSYDINDSFGISLDVTNSEGQTILDSHYNDFGGAITFFAKYIASSSSNYLRYLLVDGEVTTKTNSITITQECYDAYLQQGGFPDDTIDIYVDTSGYISLPYSAKPLDSFVWLIDFYVKRNGIIIDKYSVEDTDIVYPTPLLRIGQSEEGFQFISSKYAANPAVRYP